jgi:hypothetical protein
MQPYPFTPYLQATIAFAAIIIACSAAAGAFSLANDDTNARLVEIGVAILRADPSKVQSAASARVWALDLIDAHAGGVKFSPEARKELVDQALAATGFGGWFDYGSYDVSRNTEAAKSKPKQ